MIYTKYSYIKERFALCNRNKFKDEIGTDKYHNLLKEHIERNVTFAECIINLKQAEVEYYKLYKAEDHQLSNSNWDFSNATKIKVKLSSIESLKWNGHVVAPGLRKYI